MHRAGLSQPMSVGKEELKCDNLSSNASRHQYILGDPFNGLLVTGLCVRGGQNEAVLPSALASHKQTIERITKYVLMSTCIA